VIARNGTPWLLAETIPLTSFGRDIFAAGHSLLYLTDLAAERTPSEILLRTAFELTPAEARLAACLAGGGEESVRQLNGWESAARQSGRSSVRSSTRQAYAARPISLHSCHKSAIGPDTEASGFTRAGDAKNHRSHHSRLKRAMVCGRS
jgi:hypothetical protein